MRSPRENIRVSREENGECQHLRDGSSKRWRDRERKAGREPTCCPGWLEESLTGREGSGSRAMEEEN